MDGDLIIIRSIPPSKIERGEWVKLQPHDHAFVDVLAEMGPQRFLENAIASKYSVLTTGQRIVVQHAGVSYSLDVQESKPAKTISILGCLDLSVEFARAINAPKEQTLSATTLTASASTANLPLSSADQSMMDQVRAMSLANGTADTYNDADDDDAFSSWSGKTSVDSEHGETKSENGGKVWQRSRGYSLVDSSSADNKINTNTPHNETSSSSNTNASSSSRLGGHSFINRDNGDHGRNQEYSEKKTRLSNHASTHSGSSNNAYDDDAECSHSESDDSDDDGDNSSSRRCPGLSASYAPPPPNTTQCNNCMRYVPSSSYAMHEMHCSRQIKRCDVCNEAVKRTELDAHMQTHTMVDCEACGKSLERQHLRKHKRNKCAYRMRRCMYCSAKNPKCELDAHTAACGKELIACKDCDEMVERRMLHAPTAPNSTHSTDSKAKPNSSQHHQHHLTCMPECKCGMRVQIDCLEVHQKEYCPSRQIECPYCHLNVDFHNSQKHIEYCGGKTDKCDKCARWIKLSDFTMHHNSGCLLPEAPKSSSSVDDGSDGVNNSVIRGSLAYSGMSAANMAPELLAAVVASVDGARAEGKTHAVQCCRPRRSLDS